MTERRNAEDLQKGREAIEDSWRLSPEKSTYARLESYIELAKKGEDIRVSVTLNRRDIRMNVNPDEEPGPECLMEAYLLVGAYRITVQGEVHHVTKVYAFGSAGESSEAEARVRSVANKRLEMDYRRLAEADIHLEAKRFE